MNRYTDEINRCNLTYKLGDGNVYFLIFILILSYGHHLVSLIRQLIIHSLHCRVLSRLWIPTLLHKMIPFTCFINLWFLREMTLQEQMSHVSSAATPGWGILVGRKPNCGWHIDAWEFLRPSMEFAPFWFYIQNQDKDNPPLSECPAHRALRPIVYGTAHGLFIL